MSGFVKSACKIEICIEALLQNQALCPGVPKSVRIFFMCTQFLVIPSITQVEILWYAGAKSTDRKDQRPWSNASKVCSSTSILWTHSNVFSHRISIHRICVCLWICKSTCAKVDVHFASFARQSVRMRSNSQGAVAHKSKIGAIFPPCQEILVKKLR